MAMNYLINNTSLYHQKGLDSLGWELTVCNALYPPDTVLRKIIRRNASYGEHLYDYLRDFIPIDRVRSVMEIGGGYGYLMKDFLTRNDALKATMLDISPFLLEKQKETLAGFNVEFIAGDFLAWEPKSSAGYDLVIMNENLGDFPTCVNVEWEALFSNNGEPDPELQKVHKFFSAYKLQCPESSVFTFNVGAAEAIEKLCRARIPYIFISEHSCEAPAPSRYSQMLAMQPTNMPERIPLKGHDEYTIRFSYLQDIARGLGYISHRGSFADFIRFDMTDRIRVVLSAKTINRDEDEIIRHFIEDLFKYEYLILTDQGEGAWK